MSEASVRGASVFVEELRLAARVGVNPKERGGEQPVVMDIWVGLSDVEVSAASEELRHTIDYVWVARAARHVVERRHYPLVESLATAVAREILRRPGATWVRVRLRKPHCLKRAQAAGVEVELALEQAWAAPLPLEPSRLDDPEDVVIVGGGAAGLSAALWCWRLGHPSLVVDPAPRLGGLLHHVHGSIMDLPGMPPHSGHQLVQRLEHQFVGHGGRWLRASLAGLKPGPESCSVELQRAGVDGPSAHLTVEARAVVLAMGTRRRMLGVPGEQELQGRGMLATASSGAEEQRGRRVVVVGGGDAACENALILARAGALVTLVHRGRRLRARRQYSGAVGRHPRIAQRLLTRVVAFLGDGDLRSVSLAGPEGPEQIAADAALVRVGWEPNTAGLPRSWLDEGGFIRSCPDGRVEGQQRIFVAGDVSAPLSASLTTAFGSGAVAAHAALRLLE